MSTADVLFLLVITATFHLQAGSGKLSKSGSFNTADGSHCTWFDLRTGRTTAAIATACMCKDSNGRSQSYGCQYSAELYTCEEFVADSRKVLDGLVEQLSGMNNSCQAPQLTVHQCDDMILEREYVQQLSKPCVPHKAKEEL